MIKCLAILKSPTDRAVFREELQGAVAPEG